MPLVRLIFMSGHIEVLDLYEVLFALLCPPLVILEMTNLSSWDRRQGCNTAKEPQVQIVGVQRIGEFHLGRWIHAHDIIDVKTSTLVGDW